MPLRVTAENRTASATNASSGSRLTPQLTATRSRLRPAGISLPPNPTSDWSPITTSPATTLATAVTATIATATADAASTLPANRSALVRDRVRTVFQVP